MLNKIVFKEICEGFLSAGVVLLDVFEEVGRKIKTICIQEYLVSRKHPFS